jgi:hypothetical protein
MMDLSRARVPRSASHTAAIRSTAACTCSHSSSTAISVSLSTVRRPSLKHPQDVRGDDAPSRNPLDEAAGGID